MVTIDIKSQKEKNNVLIIVGLFIIICISLLGLAYKSYQVELYKAAMVETLKLDVFIVGVNQYCAQKLNMTHEKLLNEYWDKNMGSELPYQANLKLE